SKTFEEPMLLGIASDSINDESAHRGARRREDQIGIHVAQNLVKNAPVYDTKLRDRLAIGKCKWYRFHPGGAAKRIESGAQTILRHQTKALGMRIKDLPYLASFQERAEDQTFQPCSR